MALDPPFIGRVHPVLRLADPLRDSLEPLDFASRAVVNLQTGTAIGEAGGLLEGQGASFVSAADDVASGSVEVDRVVHQVDGFGAVEEIQESAVNDVHGVSRRNKAADDLQGGTPEFDVNRVDVDIVLRYHPQRSMFK